jgi:hypothetical protein
MGKIFLILILSAGLYGGYAMYSNITKITSPKKTSDPTEPIVQRVKAKVREIEDEIVGESPLNVYAIGHDFILVESWGIVRVGELLPDGSTLRSWASTECLASLSDGTLQRFRFARFGEMLAKSSK